MRCFFWFPFPHPPPLSFPGRHQDILADNKTHFEAEEIKRLLAAFKRVTADSMQVHARNAGAMCRIPRQRGNVPAQPGMRQWAAPVFPRVLGEGGGGRERSAWQLAPLCRLPWLGAVRCLHLPLPAAWWRF